MQLIVRGNRTHVLDVAASANVEVLRAQLAQLEVRLRLFRPKMFKRLSCQGVDAEELNLFCSGAPLEVRNGHWCQESVCIHDQGESAVFVGFLPFASLLDYYHGFIREAGPAHSQPLYGGNV